MAATQHSDYHACHSRCWAADLIGVMSRLRRVKEVNYGSIGYILTLRGTIFQEVVVAGIIHGGHCDVVKSEGECAGV